MNAKTIAFAVLFTLGAAACQNDELQSPQKSPSPMDAYVGDDFGDSNARKSAGLKSITSEYLDAINVGLAQKGLDYRIAMAEYITAGGSDEAGNTIRPKDVGNKQLEFDFVPGDTRRDWSGASATAITYAIDQTGDAVPPFGGLDAAQTTAAIVRGTETWDNASCSELGLDPNDDFGIDIGVVAFINGFGGSPFVVADVQHAGWRDINFADGILGVTFTFGFTEGGEFTDIDNNGKLDAAFREIYYDPSWEWTDDGVSNVDVESVAVHEIGHGLSQAHFGSIREHKGALKASPRAVMNALYTAPFRELTGTDNGGHCSNWGQWPNN